MSANSPIVPTSLRRHRIWTACIQSRTCFSELYVLIEVDRQLWESNRKLWTLPREAPVEVTCFSSRDLSLPCRVPSSLIHACELRPNCRGFRLGELLVDDSLKPGLHALTAAGRRGKEQLEQGHDHPSDRFARASLERLA